MIIEIESYCGDTLLFGKKRTFAVLEEQLTEIESLYDSSALPNDDFILLLCRRYGWTVLSETEANQVGTDYIYDRDTRKILTINK